MAQPALAIDAMSGDFGPRVLIPSTLRFLQSNQGYQVYLVGQSSVITPILERSRNYKLNKSRITVVDVDGVVSMDAKPAQVLRSKSETSLSVAVDLVANSQAQAIVSAGNTGALMALAMHKIKRIPEITRPAICGLLPALKGHSYLVDMGANVDIGANELLQFAQMAEVLASTVDDNQSPSVALLNIGEESVKGNIQVKETAQLLEQEQKLSGMRYTGFIEAHKLYDGVADIIVCDGFVGNIALKASEGVASYVLEKIRQEFRDDWVFKLLSLFAVPQFLRIKRKIDPRRYNGAILLGLNGIVVKSHGHADEEAFFHALEHTSQMLKHNLVERLNQRFDLSHCKKEG